MVAVTYGIRPYGGHATGWISPRVMALVGAGITFLIAFAVIELRSADPMFRLPLLRIRAFTFGTLATFLAAVARGGLMFILIIWLQGIWLPLHGFDYQDTPAMGEALPARTSAAGSSGNLQRLRDRHIKQGVCVCGRASFPPATSPIPALLWPPSCSWWSW